MSNDPMYVCIIGIHVKEIVMPCFMWHLLQSIGIFWLSSHTLYSDNLVIIYLTNSSLGMLFALKDFLVFRDALIFLVKLLAL